jgi:hypothetical protein
MVAWSVGVFAGGIAAGPLLQDYAYQGIEAGVIFLRTNLPPSWARYVPSLPEQAAAPSYAVPVPLAPAAAEPSIVAPVPGPEADKRPTPAEAPEPAPTEAAPPAVPPTTANTGAKTPIRQRAVASATVVAAKGSRHTVPSDTASHARRALASKTETTPVPDPAVPKATAPKARSREGLDDLMAGMTNDGGAKTKGNRNTSKDIDAMLKDVQKSNPAPAPKPREPVAAPPLTSADIAKAMANVKSAADTCGKRLAQKGVADLKLTVGKDGKVNAVTVGGKAGGTPLGACIEKAARAITFRPNAGLKFDYRIDVH